VTIILGVNHYGFSRGQKRAMARPMPLFDRRGVGRYPKENFLPNLPMKIFKYLFLLLFSGLWLTPSGVADVYVYKDKQGVLTFTNVPTHQGFRRVIREGNARFSNSGFSANSYEGLIRSASNRHNVDADLIRAIIKVESDFDSSARSHKGATGLMQLMPETARLHNVADLYDPSANIDGGVRHLKLLLGKYQGDLELSLAAYNAGIKAVEKHRGIPPFAETRDYVRRVLSYYQTYRGDSLQVMQ
jgi:soluble lytic murein transglycosylase-like protein